MNKELIEKIINFYKNDMGTYFDEIQGKEEDIINELESALENKDEGVINKIREDLSESEEDYRKFLNHNEEEDSLEE